MFSPDLHLLETGNQNIMHWIWISTSAIVLVVVADVVKSLTFGWWHQQLAVGPGEKRSGGTGVASVGDLQPFLDCPVRDRGLVLFCKTPSFRALTTSASGDTLCPLAMHVSDDTTF